MKRFFYITCSILCCFSILILSACSTSPEDAKLPFHCPFTEMTWESSLDEILAAEGENYSTYDSVYGGLCYTYSKEYLGLNGTIKYMLDENSNLVCVAWTYTSTDEQELYSLYDEINTSVNKTFGESGYNPQNATNYGNVWYLEDGNIILSTMLTSSNKALQYAYLHPDVSSKKPEKQSAN